MRPSRLPARSFETESDELIAQRLEAVKDFAKNYDVYCAAGKIAADSNFPFDVEVKGVMVPISSLLKYPSKQEFIDAFYAYRSPMDERGGIDADKYAHMPVEWINRKVEDNQRALLADMDAVKDKALKTVQISMNLLATQFSTGDRLSESLVGKAAEAAQHLREIADGYNNSKMLRALASTIEERIIASTKQWDTFKEDPLLKAAAARAAASVSKKLGAIGKVSKPAAVKPKAAKAVPSKGKSAAGGILARKKRKAS